MEPRDYLAAVCRRFAWVAGAGIAGALVAVALALVSTVTWTAKSSVYVGTSSAESAEALANSALVGEDLVPSIVQLATSSAVLGPVAEELDSGLTPEQLATRLQVTLTRSSSLLSISASARTPGEAARTADQVVRRLQEVAAELHEGTEGPPALRLTVVAPAQEPRFQSSPATRRNALAGLAAGLAVGVLGVGTARLVRPRVHDVEDVAVVTGAPPLTTLPDGRPGRRAARHRAAGVDRLRLLLGTSGPVRSGGRVVLLGTSRRGAGAGR